MIDGVKTCTSCGTATSLTTGFHRDRRTADGLTQACKTCKNRQKAQARLAHPEKHRHAEKARRDKDRDAFNRTRRANYAANPEPIRSYNLKRSRANPGSSTPAIRMRLYGLSPARYSAILVSQGGLCAICKAPPPTHGRVKALCVDHDHHTGAIRGLLCGDCNRALGFFHDNRTSIVSALAYLDVQTRFAIETTEPPRHVSTEPLHAIL